MTFRLWRCFSFLVIILCLLFIFATPPKRYPIHNLSSCATSAQIALNCFVFLLRFYNFFLLVIYFIYFCCTLKNLSHSELHVQFDRKSDLNCDFNATCPISVLMRRVFQFEEEKMTLLWQVLLFSFRQSNQTPQLLYCFAILI